MDNTLNVLVIGCGNIAGGFDMSAGLSEYPCTHVGAFSKDSRFSIVGCIDPDAKKRQEFMRHWKIENGYDNWDTVPSGLSVDIISICSPTACHYQDVERAITLKSKLIFCEKPVTQSSTDTRLLNDACREAGILLAVNYTRRWDPKIDDLKLAIEIQRYGQLRSIVGYYNKGILNNGSHLIDLLYLLFDRLSVEAVGKPVFDYCETDPSLPVLITASQDVPVHLVCGHAGDYSLFELQFIFSDVVVTMQQGGLSWFHRQAVASPRFKDYKSLGQGGEYTGSYQLAMSRAIDNLYNAIAGKEVLLSCGDNALKAQELCEFIKNFSSKR